MIVTRVMGLRVMDISPAKNPIPEPRVTELVNELDRLL